METEHKTESFWICYAYIINSTVGAGILAIPYEYSKAGIGFGIIVQLLASIVSILACFQVLQSWSRVEMMKSLMSQGYKIIPVPFKSILLNKPGEYIKDDTDSEKLAEDSELIPEITHKKYEFCAMVELTMGKKASRILLIVFFLHLFPGMVSYASIFSTCLASNVSLFGRDTCNLYDEDSFFNSCKITYWIYLSLFTGLMIFLSFFHIQEIKYWQIVACSMRILVFMLITITSIVAASTNKELESDEDIDASPKWFDMKYYGGLLSIVFLATLFQNALPMTTNFLENKQENFANLMYMSGATVFLLFSSVAISSNFATDDVEKAIILNWRDYSAGHSASNKPWWCYIISYVVVLLPAIDVGSAFPILCSNLSANMLSFFSDKQTEFVRNI